MLLSTMPPVSARAHVGNVTPIDYSPAYPDWEDLTPADIADHRQWCLDGCPTCDGHRVWGECPACERTREVVDDVTVCCGETPTPPNHGPGSEDWLLDGAA